MLGCSRWFEMVREFGCSEEFLMLLFVALASSGSSLKGCSFLRQKAFSP